MCSKLQINGIVNTKIIPNAIVYENNAGYSAIRLISGNDKYIENSGMKNQYIEKYLVLKVLSTI